MLRQNDIYIATEKILINCSFPFSSFINFQWQCTCKNLVSCVFFSYYILIFSGSIISSTIFLPWLALAKYSYNQLIIPDRISRKIDH